MEQAIKLLAENEEFIASLDKHFGEDYVVKSENILLHKKCNYEVRFKPHYLRKLMHKKITPCCPYCKLKGTEESDNTDK